MKLHLIWKRLSNGIALEYTFMELIRLVVLKRVFTFLNLNESKSGTKFMSIGIDEILILIISLEIREDRRKKIRDSFNQTSLPFEFINGVDGTKIKLTEYSDFFSRKSVDSLSKGSIGCILSHYKTMNAVIDSNYDYALVLEDDVFLPKDFKLQLEGVLNNVPQDFDILYLASNLSSRRDIRFWVSSNMYVPMYPRSGQYAYLVSKKGAQKIASTIKPIKILLGGIDTVIGRMVSKGELVAYHISNNLCTVDYESPSNIDNISNPGKVIFKN